MSIILLRPTAPIGDRVHRLKGLAHAKAHANIAVLKTIKELIAFVKAVSADTRIPDRDKATLVVLLALIASPFDIIPDWIPLFGIMDDIVILAVVMDYLFNHLDQQILLSHYPWGMKSYTRIRRMARFIALLTPGFIKDRIWKYKPSVYNS